MAYIEFPLRFKRQYAASLDEDGSMTTAEMSAYLSNPLRYAGQIVYCSTDDKMYRLNFARNTWITLGSSALPNQTDNAGKFLSTDGTTVSWQEIEVPEGFNAEDAVDAVATALANGTHTNATVTYNDVSNSISIAVAEGTSTGDVQDIVGAMFDGTQSGITASYNDTTGKMTLTVPSPIPADGSITTVKLETALQNKIAVGNEDYVSVALDSDITTSSGWVEIKGPIATIALTVANQDETSTTNYAPSGTYVYTIRVRAINSTTISTATINSSTLTTLLGYMQTAGASGSFFEIDISVAGLPAGARIRVRLTYTKYA